MVKRIPTVTVEAPPAVEGEIVTPDQGPTVGKPLEFYGNTYYVQDVTDAQKALLFEANEWWRKNKKWIAGAQAQLAAMPEAELSNPQNTVMAQAQQVLASAYKRVARLQTIIQGLLVDPDDWDTIADGMASRLIPWADVADLPAEIMKLYSGKQDVEPNNRAERRARGRRVAA